jgi:hypothetical protein
MVAPQHVNRGKLGGLKTHGLIRELALTDATQVSLARKYDVTEGAITQFKQKHAEAIAAVRADADNEFAGILIAQKAARLAAYEEQHRIAMTPTPKVSNKGTIVFDPETGDPVYEVNLGAANQTLKQAAEEMGQLPTRLQIQGDMQTTTTYRVEGVSPEDLT